MKPILFSTEMVEKIMSGEKTQTRRLIKPQHLRCLHSTFCKNNPDVKETDIIEKLCTPPYKVGEELYVRETWAPAVNPQLNGNKNILYKAGNRIDVPNRWYPSIHMPKEAARLFIEVSDVRAERLQDISADDCVREGVDKREADISEARAKEEFSEMWNRTIAKREWEIKSWEANPYVWVISFCSARIER